MSFLSGVINPTFKEARDGGGGGALNCQIGSGLTRVCWVVHNVKIPLCVEAKGVCFGQTVHLIVPRRKNNVNCP